LLFRLNQVLQRIKLKPLPNAVETALWPARQLVAGRLEELLSSEHLPPSTEKGHS
jgi:hypothetical protein